MSVRTRELGFRLEPCSDHLIGTGALEHALAPGIIGLVEAVKQVLEIHVAVDRNAALRALTLNTPVEALRQTIGLRRVGPCRPVLHTQAAAGRR